MKPLYKETFNHSDGVTLRDYFDEKFNSLEAKIDMQYKLSQTALDKAEVATNTRLEGLNEWRMQNKDERNAFLTTATYEAKHELLETKIESMQKIIYMALGVLFAVEFAFKFLVK